MGDCGYYQQGQPSLRPIQNSSAKMTAKEDPELISFYGHMESTSTYRAIPPEEELRAD